jgi:hypothetical protein
MESSVSLAVGEPIVNRTVNSIDIEVQPAVYVSAHIIPAGKIINSGTIANIDINSSADQIRVINSQIQTNVSIEPYMVADYYSSSDLDSSVTIGAGAERIGEYDADSALESNVTIDVGATVTRYIDSDISVSSTVLNPELDRIAVAIVELLSGIEISSSGPTMVRVINSYTSISIATRVRVSRGNIAIGQPYGWGIRIKHLV